MRCGVNAAPIVCVIGAGVDSGKGTAREFGLARQCSCLSAKGAFAYAHSSPSTASHPDSRAFELTFNRSRFSGEE